VAPSSQAQKFHDIMGLSVRPARGRSRRRGARVCLLAIPHGRVSAGESSVLVEGHDREQQQFFGTCRGFGRSRSDVGGHVERAVLIPLPGLQIGPGVLQQAHRLAVAGLEAGQPAAASPRCWSSSPPGCSRCTAAPTAKPAWPHHTSQRNPHDTVRRSATRHQPIRLRRSPHADSDLGVIACARYETAGPADPGTPTRARPGRSPNPGAPSPKVRRTRSSVTSRWPAYRSTKPLSVSLSCCPTHCPRASRPVAASRYREYRSAGNQEGALPAETLRALDAKLAGRSVGSMDR
jgi:hypothetical protein